MYIEQKFTWIEEDISRIMGRQWKMEKVLLSIEPVLVESDEVQACRTKSELVLFHMINCLYIVVSANFTFTAKTWP
jgi:hypothetical protein